MYFVFAKFTVCVNKGLGYNIFSVFNYNFHHAKVIG